MLENAELDLIDPLAVTEDLFTQATFFAVPALLEVGERARVAGQDGRPDTMHAKRVEAVAQDKFLGFGAVALLATILLADDGARRGVTIEPVDPVDAHVADVAILLLENDGEMNVRREGAEGLVLDPILLGRFADRHLAQNILSHVGIVHPTAAPFGVLPFQGTEIQPTTFEKDGGRRLHGVFAFS